MNFYLTLVVFVFSIFFAYFILNRIREKYIEDDPMLIKLRAALKDTFPDINNVILLRGEKSYTINKKKIHLCLKDEKGDYYHQNMLVFVLLHEFAHVRCDEIGHTDKFHHIFKGLLDTASHHGIYNPNQPIIKDYCTYNDKK